MYKQENREQFGNLVQMRTNKNSLPFISLYLYFLLRHPQVS